MYFAVTPTVNLSLRRREYESPAAMSEALKYSPVPSGCSMVLTFMSPIPSEVKVTPIVPKSPIGTTSAAKSKRVSAIHSMWDTRSCVFS